MTVQWDEVQAAVNRAAGAVSRRYGSFTTFEDMCQDGYEWALRHPGRLDHYLLEDGTVYRNLLVSDLTAYLTKVAKRERAAVLGHLPGDQFGYTADMVELVLPALWDATYRPPVVEVRSSSASDPAFAGNWEAMVADVRAAVDGLPSAQARVLLAYYGMAHGWRDAAVLLGMSKTAANNMGRQAVDRVVDVLNGVPDEGISEPRQVTGSRRAISNATAAAVVSFQWEG